METAAVGDPRAAPGAGTFARFLGTPLLANRRRFWRGRWSHPRDRAVVAMSAVYIITEEQLRELAEIRERLGRILANAVVVVGSARSIQDTIAPSCLANRETLRLNGSHAPIIESPCPRCGHVHECLQDCGAEIAKGRFCHCEREGGGAMNWIFGGMLLGFRSCGLFSRLSRWAGRGGRFLEWPA